MLNSKYQIPNTKNRKYKLNFRLLKKLFSLRHIFYFLIFSFFLLFVSSIFSFAEEQFIYDDKFKRNPFMPLVTSDGRIIDLDREENSEICIEGIIYSEKGPSYAIINQSVVKIDDWIGDYRIVKIDRDAVIFLKNGQIIKTEIKKEEK